MHIAHCTLPIWNIEWYLYSVFSHNNMLNSLQLYHNILFFFHLSCWKQQQQTITEYRIVCNITFMTFFFHAHIHYQFITMASRSVSWCWNWNWDNTLAYTFLETEIEHISHCDNREYINNQINADNPIAY